jgi:hypothetical protein
MTEPHNPRIQVPTWSYTAHARCSVPAHSTLPRTSRELRRCLPIPLRRRCERGTADPSILLPRLRLRRHTWPSFASSNTSTCTRFHLTRHPNPTRSFSFCPRCFKQTVNAGLRPPLPFSLQVPVSTTCYTKNTNKVPRIEVWSPFNTQYREAYLSFPTGNVLPLHRRSAVTKTHASRVYHAAGPGRRRYRARH